MKIRRDVIKPVRDLVEVTVEQSGAYVDGHGRGGVPEHPLHRLDGRASRHSQARFRVTKIVRRRRRQAGLLTAASNTFDRKFEFRRGPPRLDADKLVDVVAIVRRVLSRLAHQRLDVDVQHAGHGQKDR